MIPKRPIVMYDYVVMKCVLCKSNSFTILFAHHKKWNMGKCTQCGLVQVVPMPTAKEIASLYHEDLEHFDPYVDQLAVHHAYFKKKTAEILQRVIPVKEGIRTTRKHNSGKAGNDMRLLDIGCAMGVLLEEARAVGFRSVGIDLSADAVTYCTQHSLTAYTGTVYTVKKLQDASFDVISAFQIIEHERDPLRMMIRIHKLLKKGGLVILATPNQGGMWQKIMGKRWFGYRHPEHVVLLDFDTMRKLLQKAGFSHIEILSDSPRPFPLSFAFTRAGDYFPFLAWLLKPLGKLLDHFKIINPINPWDDMICFARK